MIAQGNDTAFLYRLYYSLIMRDILYHLGFDSNRKNKAILHDFHKRILGYKSIAGLNYDRLSYFISEVLLLWAENGIFVRSKKEQEIGIEKKSLKELWKIL